MPRTRLSLYYLVTYLLLTGGGLMFAPGPVLRFLFASRAYDDVMPRFVGILMVAIALIVSQIIRFKVETLYPMTVLIRLMIWSYVAWLFYYSRDPFFLAVLGVLGLGILLTGFSYLAERPGRRGFAAGSGLRQ